MIRKLSIGLTGLLLGLSGCAQSAKPSTVGSAASAASPSEAAVVIPANAIASGAFEGRSDHITLGAMSITKVDGGYELVFADDFSLDGAPDPVVGFGSDGTYDEASMVGALQNKTGAQSYSLPAGFDPAAYNEVYVWCGKFSVPLGVASYAVEAEAVASPAAAAPAPVKTALTGTFEGRSDHITLGAMSITKVDGGYELVFADDFSLDGAPDPVVGFGSDGTYDEASMVGALQNKTGAQSYSLPAGFDPAAYNEVYVWCGKFSVPLGVASYSVDAAASAPEKTALTGTFEGRSDHITLGEAKVVAGANGYELVFADDFSLDGAPDPTVGFGKDGAYDASTTLGALKQKTGAQSYSLPSDFDPAVINEVYVWCDKFDVPLGVASLK